MQPADNDTAIFKNRPVYFAKMNGKGKFGFDYLPFTSYQIFVVPNDYTKRYDDSTKFFAFNDAPVTVNRNNDSIQLFAFQAYPKLEKKKNVNKNALKRNTTSLKYTKDLDGAEQDVLHALHLTFETPIHLNDSFPIILADTFNRPMGNYSVKVDSLFSNMIVVDYPWKNSMSFHLIVPQNAVRDTLNNKLFKTDTLSFNTKPASAYGSCMMRINGYDQFKNPILLLTQEDKIKFSFPITKNVLNIAQLPPGDFQLKILEDENNNGKWDTGKFGYGNQNKQPEKVWMLPNKLNIRADWDNELNITINK